MFKIMSAALLATTLLISPLPANAQTLQPPPCGERDQIVKRLLDKYGEAPVAGGLGQSALGPNGLVELYVSEETGTWTILVTLPNRQSCLLAVGLVWENALTPIPQSGEPT